MVWLFTLRVWLFTIGVAISPVVWLFPLRVWLFQDITSPWAPVGAKNAQNVIHLSPLHSLADVITLPAKERQRTSRPTLCYCQKMSLGIICLILLRPLARFKDLEVTSPFSSVQLREWEDYCVSREKIRGQICDCIERQFSNKYSYLIQDSVVSVI